MTVDTAVVEERLGLMKQLLDDLASVGEVDAERLTQDRLIRHAVERIITQLVDLSVSLNSHVVAATKHTAPATYRESYHAVAELGLVSQDLATKIAPAAGLRNILTHEYVTVDLRLVAAAVPMVRELFGEYVSGVARYLADGAGQE